MNLTFFVDYPIVYEQQMMIKSKRQEFSHTHKSRCGHGVVMVYTVTGSRCGHGVVTVWSRCSHGVVTVWSRCGNGVFPYSLRAVLSLPPPRRVSTVTTLPVSRAGAGAARRAIWPARHRAARGCGRRSYPSQSRRLVTRIGAGGARARRERAARDATRMPFPL